MIRSSRNCKRSIGLRESVQRMCQVHSIVAVIRKGGVIHGIDVRNRHTGQHTCVWGRMSSCTPIVCCTAVRRAPAGNDGQDGQSKTSGKRPHRLRTPACFGNYLLDARLQCWMTEHMSRVVALIAGETGGRVASTSAKRASGSSKRGLRKRDRESPPRPGRSASSAARHVTYRA